VPPLRSGKLEGSSWRSIKNISSNFNDICDRETEDEKDEELWCEIERKYSLRHAKCLCL
jgi:hypothetical protein